MRTLLTNSWQRRQHGHRVPHALCDIEVAVVSQHARLRRAGTTVWELARRLHDSRDMRKTALREYLLGLVLACAPAMNAGCGGNDSGTDEIDAGIDFPICNPDFPKSAFRAAMAPAVDGGVGDCKDACIAALTAADVVFRASEVTCTEGTGEDVDAGTRGVTCGYLAPSGCGRAPAGLCAPVPMVGSDEVGAYLASAAHLEAASVIAFERLAAELAAHDAPPALVQRARAAARDERRHARTMRTLARRHGAEVPAVFVEPFHVRPLAELAHENAVAGQVDETYGAVVALHQARAARLPGIRRAMRAIAADELAHAELAWAVSRWAESSLSAKERARLAGSRRAAAARLVRAPSDELSAEARAQLGLPDAAQARVLLGHLARDVWSC